MRELVMSAAILAAIVGCGSAPDTRAERANAQAQAETPIPGLLVVRLELHEDARGWFKENWQREKMVALGLPDFGPVQNNMSFNAARGATRGVHTEPWDKFVSLASGRIFGAWVDMRQGDTFGVGVKWVAMPRRLELGLDATWSDMTGRIATATGTLNINPVDAAAAYRERLIGPMRGLLPEAALRSPNAAISAPSAPCSPYRRGMKRCRSAP